MRSDPSRVGPLAGLAGGGVVLGHALAYLLAHHDATERHRHLALTGHGSFHDVTLLAGIAAGVAIVALAIRAVRWGPVGDIRGRQLAAAQVAAFAAMEVVERGGSIQAAFSDRAVRIGLLLQLAIGLLLAVVVRLFERTVATVTARLRRPVRRIETTTTPLAGERYRPRPVIRGTLRLRAPPPLLALS